MIDSATLRRPLVMSMAANADHLYRMLNEQRKQAAAALDAKDKRIKELERDLEQAQRNCSAAILDYNEIRMERIDLNDDGSLDGILGAPAYLEQMDDDLWFLSIGDYAVWLQSETKIVASYEKRGPDSDLGEVKGPFHSADDVIAALKGE